MDGLFALTGVLCLAAMALVKFQVPDPPARRAAPAPGATRASLLDAELLRLNAGIFVLHVVLYAMFVVVPPLLVRRGTRIARALEGLSTGGAGLFRADGAGDPVCRPA